MAGGSAASVCGMSPISLFFPFISSDCGQENFSVSGLNHVDIPEYILTVENYYIQEMPGKFVPCPNA